MTAPAAANSATAQAALEAVAVAATADLGRAFTSLDVQQLAKSLPNFAALFAAIVRRYSLGSAAVAAQQYKAQRLAAGVTGAFTVKPAPPPPLPQVGAVVSWATQPLWAQDPAIDAAVRNLTAGVEKLVLDRARNTVIENVRRDPKAHGWARVTEPAPCSFCALLATRGAVYKQDTAGFRSHNNCRCHAEPSFGPWEPPAQVREWQQMYRESTSGIRGARAMRAAWRQTFQQQEAPA